MDKIINKKNKRYIVREHTVESYGKRGYEGSYTIKEFERVKSDKDTRTR